MRRYAPYFGEDYDDKSYEAGYMNGARDALVQAGIEPDYDALGRLMRRDRRYRSASSSTRAWREAVSKRKAWAVWADRT